MQKKNIVILGAGYGGVHAAKILSKKYKRNNDIEITLIDRNPVHTLMTELHEVAGGRVEPDSVQVDLRKIFHKSKVNIVTEEVKNVNVNKQVLVTEFSEYKYDYLILGTGSEPAYFGVPGVQEHGFSLWSLEDAIKIRHHIENMFKLASKERNTKKRQAMLTFAVAGAGFTGIEMIGELIEWKKKLCLEYNVDQNDVGLMVVEALDSILNILDSKMALKAERYMLKHKVEILKNAAITEVTPDDITLKDGRRISTKTLIWTCGVQGNSFAKSFGLSLTNRGRINTNEFMQSLDKENIYVVGDAAFLEEGKSNGLPQIVEAALQTAETASKNIIADIQNTEKKAFKSNYHGFMVSIGSHYAVADVGGMKLSGFLATAMKHLVNLHYLFGVGGFYLIFRYLFHEFFDIKERRSILGGHLSAKSPSFWLIPLRLFLGSMWVLEGTKKLIGEETWAKASGLNKITSGIGTDSWFLSGNVKMPFQWLYVSADGTASASVTAPETLATPILSKMPGFFESIMKLLIPNPEVAVWFQRLVVLTEIGIGLCLLAGLFTWLASAASAFMVVNFVLSAMAGYEILWYFFGAIALMGGAGRSFGLDYFVMPWIGKILGNFWLGKQKPIYKDGTSAKL
ncbi:MAG: FAD-dependent oxidoreductase [Clostridiaceae bacterium]